MTAARARSATGPVRGRLAAVVVRALGAALLVPGPAAAAPVTPLAPAGCATPSGPDGVACLTVLGGTVTAARPATPGAPAAPVPDGITPTQLRAAYGVSDATAPTGTTVGIVVPYDAPDVETDLARFRSTYGLPACTTANGCFRKVDERGVPVPAGKSTTSTTPPVYSSTWEVEATLDVQAVSAMCPSCRILLVEADDLSLTASLGPATLRAQTLGAAVISNSFAAVEPEEAVPADANWWSKVTVPVFAGSGDDAFYNEANPAAGSREIGYYPATSPTVIGVGGTSATVSGNTLTNEVTWLHDDPDPTKVDGSGSGCSKLFARPAYQLGYFAARNYLPDSDRFCSTVSPKAPVPNVSARASADLSALADPSTGFPLAIDGGWTTAGGTSLSVQLVAALAAHAGPRATGTSVSDVMYGLAARGAPTGLLDITRGSNVPNGGQGCAGNAVCTARPGWDGPTGLGTPRGLSVFAPLLTVSPTTSVPGGRVSTGGSNLLPGEQVTVTAADGTVLATTTAAADGTWSARVTVPRNVPSPVVLTATGATSGFTASRSVTIGTPALTLAPAAGVVPRQQLTVTLANFAADEPVTVTLPDGTGTSVVTDDNGAATAVLTVPDGAQGSLTVTATGTSSQLTATATVTVADPAAAPRFQAVVVGSTATVTATGFGAGETVTVTPAAGGTPVARTSAGADGSATLTWTASGTSFGTTALTVTGAGTGRTATVFLDLLAAATGAPDVPTVLSVVPTTDGGVLVGLRAAATGAAPTSVTVLTSTGTLATRVPVTTGGDAFVTLPGVPTGTTLTVQALAGNAVGDSGLSVASVPVTANLRAGTGDLTPVGPVRIADTRQPGGPFAGGKLPSRAARVLPVAGRAGVPGTGVAAVVLSVTVVAPSAPTYLTLWPDGEAQPVVSNANVAAGITETSLVKVKLGSDGAVAVYNRDGSTDVVVDVLGFYAAAGTSISPPVFAHNQSYASTPVATRVLDTRTLASSPLRAGAGRITVPVRGAAGVPADATAVELQVQAVTPLGLGYLTVYPTGTPQPFVSQVLFDRDRPGITAVVATLGADGSATVYASAGTEVVVDVVGWYAPSAAGRFVPISPRRYLDTRTAEGGAGPVVTAAPRSVLIAGGTALDGTTQVPGNATDVAFQLTSVTNTAPAYVTAWPTGTVRPVVTSLLPVPAGGTYDNLVLSSLRPGGAVSLFLDHGATDFLVDVQGYYVTTGS